MTFIEHTEFNFDIKLIGVAPVVLNIEWSLIVMVTWYTRGAVACPYIVIYALKWYVPK